MPRAVEMAEMIGANAPLAVQGSKTVVQFWWRYSLEESYQLNAAVGHRVYTSEDAKDGPKAFAEKRTPVWKGAAEQSGKQRLSSLGRVWGTTFSCKKRFPRRPSPQWF